jgi:hypothetical protein
MDMVLLFEPCVLMPTFDPIRERFYVRMQAATEQIRAKVAKSRGFIPGNSV